MTLAQQIDSALNSNPEGWCSPTKAHAIAACVSSMGGGTVVEIGVYAGRSLIPLALAVKDCGEGQVIGIDPFNAEVSAEGEQGENAEWWERLDHDRIENILREFVAESGVEDVVQIVKAKSEEVTPPDRINVLHVDGQHMDKAVRDVERFAPRVVIGGFCILDDLTWEGGRVEKAAECLLAHGFVERRRLLGEEEETQLKNDFAVYQRTHFC